MGSFYDGALKAPDRLESVFMIYRSNSPVQPPFWLELV